MNDCAFAQSRFGQGFALNWQCSMPSSATLTFGVRPHAYEELCFLMSTLVERSGPMQ